MALLRIKIVATVLRWRQLNFREHCMNNLLTVQIQCWSKVSHILGYDYSVTPLEEGG